MISITQLQANQENARRSTGPITEEGKARCSQNALRHGLTAKTVLLPTEDPEAYQKHCHAYFHRFAPREQAERQLTQQLADIQWRLARVPGLEASLLENGDVKALATISLYEQRLLRTFEKTLALLEKLLDETHVSAYREPQPAQSKEEPKNGSVCSTSYEFCRDCCTWDLSEARCEQCKGRKWIATPSLPYEDEVVLLPEAA